MRPDPDPEIEASLAGPRFWPDDRWPIGAHDAPAAESVRWIGLRRAWRMAWHLRACLALLTLLLLAAGALQSILDPFVHGTIGALVAMTLFLGLVAVLAYLFVLILLGIIQALTGWPLHEAERWTQSLPWYATLGVQVVLLVAVCLPTVVLVVGSLLLSASWAGLLKPGLK